MNRTKKAIAVLGIGTAGITSLSHCLSYLSEDWTVYSVYDPNTPILGIGESTTVAIPYNLYTGAKFTLFRDSHHLDATIKHGVKYVGWREHDIFSHIIPPSHGIHFNNFKLKDFAFSRFREICKDKFKIIQSKVIDINSTVNHIELQLEQEKIKFDYIIDCRGYPDDYDDYVISEHIPVNHCLVHMIDKPGDWTWTYHKAHRNGWMFGIPLTTRQGWGYLYNDTITEKRDAEEDIAERFETRVSDLNLREFSFKNYYAKKFIDGRLIKNGNRALFFEPIEAMSGFFYDQVMKHFFDVLNEASTEKSANQYLANIANDMESFICYIYHGGSTYQSEFWNHAKAKSYEKLSRDFRFKSFLAALKAMPNHQRSAHELYGIFTTPNWVDFDKQFGYHYFTENTESKDH